MAIRMIVVSTMLLMLVGVVTPASAQWEVLAGALLWPGMATNKAILQPVGGVLRTAGSVTSSAGEGTGHIVGDYTVGIMNRPAGNATGNTLALPFKIIGEYGIGSVGKALTATGDWIDPPTPKKKEFGYLEHQYNVYGRN